MLGPLSRLTKADVLGVGPKHGDFSNISPGDSIVLFYFHRKRKQKEKSEAPFVEFQAAESKGVVLETRWKRAFPAPSSPFRS